MASRRTLGLRVLALCGLLLTVACGQAREASHTDGLNTNQRAYWDSVAPRCNGYPSKADCDDGDMVLFAGLLCASGDSRGCTQVRDSQDGDGRWWRSPRRNPGNLGGGESFSRDMAMGVMLYLETSGDTRAAQRWLDWIESSRPCVTPKPWGGGCLVRGPQRFCPDEVDHSCTLTPASWGLLGRVWDHLGLDRTDEMTTDQNADIDTLPAQAQTAPVGYAMHLTGVEVLLKQHLGTLEETRQQAARDLVNRQGDNLFFQYLANGASEALTNRLAAICPAAGSGRGGGDQWSWERDTSTQPWNDSMSWDCLFLANLLGAKI